MDLETEAQEESKTDEGTSGTTVCKQQLCNKHHLDVIRVATKKVENTVEKTGHKSCPSQGQITAVAQLHTRRTNSEASRTRATNAWSRIALRSKDM